MFFFCMIYRQNYSLCNGNWNYLGHQNVFWMAINVMLAFSYLQTNRNSFQKATGNKKIHISIFYFLHDAIRKINEKQSTKNWVFCTTICQHINQSWSTRILHYNMTLLYLLHSPVLAPAKSTITCFFPSNWCWNKSNTRMLMIHYIRSPDHSTVYFKFITIPYLILQFILLSYKK